MNGASPDSAASGAQDATQPLTRREAREAAGVDGAVDATPAAPQEPAPTVAMNMDALIGAESRVGDEALLSADPTGAATVAFAATAVGDDADGTAAATPTASKAGAASAGGGIGALIAKHPNVWLFSALGVAFVLLGAGAVFAGSTFGPTPVAAVLASPSPTPTVEPPRPVPSATTAATRLRTCSIGALAADPRLGTFEGSVLNASTGEVLFDRSAGTPAPTASVMKTLIAATALKVLGPDYRLSTKVYAGSEDGTVVLVGGGDPTLSAGGGSVYPDPPQLSDLAAQVKGAYDKPITDIILDATMWNNGDAWDPSWPETERTHGYQPRIVPLMVDGDRANPRAQDSPRSTDPVMAAGKAFAAALGVPDAKLTLGSAITTNPQLGEVKSQPVRSLIAKMLPVSDNTLAEMLARVSSKVAGKDGSAASLTGVVTSALASYGVVAPNLAIKDGSGESKNDGVPPLVVAQLMAKVLAGADNLNIIYDSLPVSGKTGTLAGRFTGANAVARGAVNAKTGSIANVYTLGGIVHAADGTSLAFAFYALGNVRSSAMAAIDTVTTGAFKCGDNLSNN